MHQITICYSFQYLETIHSVWGGFPHNPYSSGGVLQTVQHSQGFHVRSGNQARCPNTSTNQLFITSIQPYRFFHVSKEKDIGNLCWRRQWEETNITTHRQKKHDSATVLWEQNKILLHWRYLKSCKQQQQQEQQRQNIYQKTIIIVSNGHWRSSFTTTTLLTHLSYPQSQTSLVW